VRILLTGNICNLPFKQQVAATTAAFAALPFVDKIKTVCYLAGMKDVARGHLRNRYEVHPFELTFSSAEDIDAVVDIAYGGFPMLFQASFLKTGKPVYWIDADNPTIISDAHNISSAEVCRIRGWNVGDVVSATTVPLPLVVYDVPQDDPVEFAIPAAGKVNAAPEAVAII
jgi:hypothetical protein